MSFVMIPNFEGRLYVPERDPADMRKHECEGCFSCQMCSDDRCALCLQTEGCRPGPEDPLTSTHPQMVFLPNIGVVRKK